jgi:hypothetical protein
MEKIRLLVPPSDTARDSERWYEFAIYLSKLSGASISPLVSTTAAEYRDQLPQADLVYSAPEQVPNLIREHRFTPLMQPIQLFEEVAIVSGPSASQNNLKGINGEPLGGIQGSFANRLGLTTLTQKQIRPSSMEYRKSWLELLKALQRGELPYALLSKNFIDQLSELSLTSINLLARSNLRKAFPLLMYAASLKPQAAELRQALQEMTDDPKAQPILEKLNNQGWQKPSEQSIINMVKILRGK